MTVSTTKRKGTYARDGQCCAACTTTENLTIQHRMNKQMGGSKFREGYEFYLTLCWGCNTALTSDATFYKSGIANGWQINTWENPLTVAVWIAWAREWRLLDAEGGYTVVDGREPDEEQVAA